MENDEAIEVLELAVKYWHKVAKDHDIKKCNCFRDEFGKALIKKYGVKLYG